MMMIVTLMRMRMDFVYFEWFTRVQVVWIVPWDPWIKWIMWTVSALYIRKLHLIAILIHLDKSVCNKFPSMQLVS